MSDTYPHNATTTKRTSATRIVQAKFLHQIVANLEGDDGGLIIRMRRDHLPPEMIDLPLGTIVISTVEVTIPPTIWPISDDTRQRAKKYGNSGHDDQAIPGSD